MFQKARRILSTGIILHLCTISLATEVIQDIKIWHPNTNFQNPRNWEKQELPCENDRIIFPDSYPVISMMPESLTAGELVLPVNGEIIFPEKSTVELTGGTREGSCNGKDVHFKMVTDYWYDPSNWNITSDQAFPRIPNRRNAAVPHAFQVPCPTDEVHFPEKSTFQSYVLYPLTKVASMVINGKSYSQGDFDGLLRTHLGSLLFPNSPRIHITSAPCTDPGGCICGNDGQQVLPTICNEVTPLCPELDCTDPITPTGSCCPICGARITMKNNNRFLMSELMVLHFRFLREKKFRKVESFTAKTSKGDIQSVFVDGAQQYKGIANKAAQNIYNILNTDMGRDLYGVLSISFDKSEAWKSGVPTYDKYTSKGMSSGGIAGLVITFIVIFGLAVLIYIYKKRYVPGFNFARFDLRGDKIELELGTTPHDELQPVDAPVGESSKDGESRGFDNPVYGTAVEEVSPPTIDETAETKDFVENPMFMIFEETSTQGKKEDE